MRRSFDYTLTLANTQLPVSLSPSPHPSPAGRGGHAVRVTKDRSVRVVETAGSALPLPRRERAGVRVKTSCHQNRPHSPERLTPSSKSRALPPFEFENWAVIALGGVKTKVQVGDMGIDGRIFPVGSEPQGFGSDELGLQERWYPIQVKQKDKAGRPDIDQFENAMRRAKYAKGFFVSFAFSEDALREIQRFFVEEHAVIVPLTVQEILEEQIGMKLV